MNNILFYSKIDGGMRIGTTVIPDCFLKTRLKVAQISHRFTHHVFSHVI